MEGNGKPRKEDGVAGRQGNLKQRNGRGEKWRKLGFVQAKENLPVQGHWPLLLRPQTTWSIDVIDIAQGTRAFYWNLCASCQTLIQNQC